MPPISEKWKMIVGKEEYIITGKEKDAILNAGEARFVKFRDLVINPAYVASIELIETNAPKLEKPKIRIYDDYGDYFET